MAGPQGAWLADGRQRTRLDRYHSHSNREWTGAHVAWRRGPVRRSQSSDFRNLVALRAARTSAKAHGARIVMLTS